MSGNAGCCSDMLLQVSFLHWELLLAHNIASSHLEQTGTVQQYYTVSHMGLKIQDLCSGTAVLILDEFHISHAYIVTE